MILWILILSSKKLLTKSTGTSNCPFPYPEMKIQHKLCVAPHASSPKVGGAQRAYVQLS